MRKFGKRRWLTAGVLLAAVACTGVIAQEQEPAPEPETAETDQPEAPFQWQANGETVEDFQVEFTPFYEVDRSTPTALVKSYAAYGDERTSALKALAELTSKWEAALLSSLQEREQALLTSEAVNALRAVRDRRKEQVRKYVREPDPMTVAGVTPGKDGTRWVEATQTVKLRKQDWETGEWRDSTEERKLRFACVQGEDGTWRIDGVEKWDKDWENMDEEGHVEEAWIEEATPLTAVVYARKQAEALGEVPPLKQSTPSEAALSLFESLFKRRQELDGLFVEKGLAPWAMLLSGLFTKEYVARQEKKFEDWSGDTDEPEREIDGTVEKDGVTVVKFKARDEWNGSIELHLKRFEDAWKVHKTGYYKLGFDDSGNEVWEFIEEPDVYALMYR